MCCNRISNFIATLALVAAVGTGCAEEIPTVGCSSDSECAAGQFCDDGVCKCRTDDQCGEGNFCNAFGNCQPRPPCLGNQDCADGFICNTSDATGGKCILDQNCGSSVHCAFNEYCRIEQGADSGACVAGCRGTDDCQLGWVCQAGYCQSSATSGDCQTCPNPVADASYCDYGELCKSNGTDDGAGDCTAVQSQSGLCKTCDTFDCDPGLACIVDEEEQNQNYCAPTCATDSDCPSGYPDCGGLVFVCGLCSSDADCALSGGGTCRQSSESNQGYCTCTSQAQCELNPPTCFFGSCTAGPPCSNNSDCAAIKPGSTCSGGIFGGGACSISCSNNDDCTCIGGKCFNSGMPCTTATASVDCGSTFAPLPGTPNEGLCNTNTRICGKDAGFSCDELTGNQALCRQLGQQGTVGVQ